MADGLWSRSSFSVCLFDFLCKYFLPGIKPQLHHLPALWPGVSCELPLGLGFYLRPVEVVRLLLHRGL